jgi:hypothetical protein
MKIVKEKELGGEILYHFRTNERERSRNAPIYDAVAKLAVGEALIFSADEWKGNRYPTQAIGNLTALKSKDGRYPSYNWAFSKLGRQMVGKRFSVRLKEDGYVVIRKEDRKCRPALEHAITTYEQFVKEWELEKTQK